MPHRCSNADFVDADIGATCATPYTFCPKVVLANAAPACPDFSINALPIAVLLNNSPPLYPPYPAAASADDAVAHPPAQFHVAARQVDLAPTGDARETLDA